MTTSEQAILHTLKTLRAKLKGMREQKEFPLDIDIIAARDIKLIPGFEFVSIKDITPMLESLGAKSLPLIPSPSSHVCGIALMSIGDHEKVGQMSNTEILEIYHDVGRMLT